MTATTRAMKRRLKIKDLRKARERKIALKKPDNAADGYFLRLAQEEITTVITAFGIDQTAAFELSKDNFQKSQGNRLRLGNFGDLDRPRPDPSGKLDNGAEGVLVPLGKKHPLAFLTYLVGNLLDPFSRESKILSIQFFTCVVKFCIYNVYI